MSLDLDAKRAIIFAGPPLIVPPSVPLAPVRLGILDPTDAFGRMDRGKQPRYADARSGRPTLCALAMVGERTDGAAHNVGVGLARARQTASAENVLRLLQFRLLDRKHLPGQ